MPSVAFTKATFKTFVEAIFVGKPEEAESYLSTLLDDRFEQKDDGVRRNKADFIKHVKDIRLAAQRWEIQKVVWLVQDGRRLGGRYYVAVTLPKWGVVDDTKSYLCEQTQDITVGDNGKVLGITENTRKLLDGEEMWEPAMED